jgi:hypothetical protein
MKDPAILFYTSDFLTGTFTMTDDQVGKYIRLLCLQHQKGGLSENDMLNICKTYDKDIYSKFVKNGDNLYYNDRMKFEAEKRKKYSESRQANRLSKREGTETPDDMKNISESYVEHMENENTNTIIYSLFYDSEILKAKGKPQEPNYLMYVNKIFGKIGIYGKMDKILKIKSQLTFEQFEKLIKESLSKGIDLMDLIEKFDNYEGKYKPGTVYKSLLNWMDYEIQRKKK